MPTLEQLRAADALNKVKVLEALKDQVDFKDKYAQVVVSFPSAVIMNGLGQAVATLLASGTEAEKLLYEHLQGWLCRSSVKAPFPNGGSLIQSIVENERKAYVQAQVEALVWLEWLKKFAVAFLKNRKEKEKGGASI